MTNKMYHISGMDCDSCAKLLELDLEDVGIIANCSYPSSTLTAEVNTKTEPKLKAVVSKAGYSISPVAA